MRPALDIIAFTVKQGLAHPMQCLPVLVALETSADPVIVQKAFSLHSLVHNKHGALVNTRIGESVQAAYSYQKHLSGEQTAKGWSGDPPTAHLARWYSLMREKRPWRLEFLKAIVRGLQVEADGQPFDQGGVELVRFTADNLATFEYKTLEEVFFVIRSCMIMLSMVGMQLVGFSTASKERALTIFQYHQVQENDMQAEVHDPKAANMTVTLRKTIASGIVFCLRNHLKTVYGVTDQ